MQRGKNLQRATAGSIIIIIIVSLQGRHSTGDQQRLTYHRLLRYKDEGKHDSASL